MPASKTATTDDVEETRAPRNLPRRGQSHNPGLYTLLGILLLILSLVIITLQTQTSEAYVNGVTPKDETITAQWNIWLQIPKLVFGNRVPGDDVTQSTITGIIVGQTVELLYIIAITARKLVVYASRKMEKVVGFITLLIIVLIGIFDFFTDAAYGVAPFQAHLMFAALCTFIIGFGPTLSLTLMQHGYKRL